MTRIYGEFAFGDGISVAHADQILGARISLDNQGRPEWIDLQYQTADGSPFQELRMDYPNALFILSLLKSIQLDMGTPFPDDPRGARP